MGGEKKEGEKSERKWDGEVVASAKKKQRTLGGVSAIVIVILLVITKYVQLCTTSLAEEWFGLCE